VTRAERASGNTRSPLPARWPRLLAPALPTRGGGRNFRPTADRYAIQVLRGRLRRRGIAPVQRRGIAKPVRHCQEV